MRGKHFAMVSEWMVNGSINEFIKANRDANRFTLVGLPFRSLLRPALTLRQLKGVTKGLIYMHYQGMVHGDLKGV